jgi:hypothetical protein
MKCFICRTDVGLNYRARTIEGHAQPVCLTCAKAIDKMKHCVYCKPAVQIAAAPGYEPEYVCDECEQTQARIDAAIERTK